MVSAAADRGGYSDGEDRGLHSKDEAGGANGLMVRMMMMMKIV